MCIQTLQTNGYNVDVVDSYTCDWSKAEAYSMMKKNYPKLSEPIELIFSNNDDMALGAIQYLCDENIFKDTGDVADQPFPIIGVDATDVGMNAIRGGYMYGTILNDANTQASAIVALTNYLKGKITFDQIGYKFDENNVNYIYIDGKIITKDTNAG
jgi:methyl-galactoside transport system substrate-binding protein